MNMIELSKGMAYILRHTPSEHGLVLDCDGWTSLEGLLEVLRKKKGLEKVQKQDIEKMIGSAEKKRFEINGERIRAYYGHSTQKKIEKKAETPPLFLYHGTSHTAWESIQKEGLIPGKRQYVHLASKVEMALEVGKRYDEKPVLLKVNAEAAHREGILFYHGNDFVWLSDVVPAKYIEEVK